MDASGDLIDVEVALGLEPTLDASLIDAVRQWRFTPGTVNGEPAEFRLTVILIFESGPSLLRPPGPESGSRRQP